MTKLEELGTSFVVRWLRICLPAHGSIPGWEPKLPHAVRELSLGATAAESVLWKPCATTREKPMSHS